MSRNWIVRFRICDKTSKFGFNSTTTGLPGFFGGFTFATQFTMMNIIRQIHGLRPSSKLTGNGNVSLLSVSLRIGKEQHDAVVILPPENTQVLANAFLAAAFRFGLSHSPNKDQLRGKETFLELYTVYQRVSMAETRHEIDSGAYRPSSRSYTIVGSRRPHWPHAPFDDRGRRHGGGIRRIL